MEVVVLIILGGLSGWFASLLMGVNEEQGVLSNVAVGITGALFAGMIMYIFGQYGVYTMLIAMFGAVILLHFGQLLRKVA